MNLSVSTSRERLRVGVANYSVLLAIGGGVITGTVAGAIVAEVLVVAWLVGHLVAWWLPYFGLSTASQRDAYRRDYARTLKILPTAGRAVVVDVQHTLVVGALTLPMVALSRCTSPRWGVMTATHRSSPRRQSDGRPRRS